MIFITVGAQMPFDRMIKTVDQWAGLGSSEFCFAQIGDTTYRPKNIECVKELAPKQYEQRIRQSRLVVAHAGMGSILTAMRLKKPILIFPRHAELLETRNNHQVSTIRYFRGLDGIYVAATEAELLQQLDCLQQAEAPSEISPYASDQLISTISGFIENTKPRSVFSRRPVSRLLTRLTTRATES